jgi:two-component system NtrC family sensor kinase
MAEGADLTVEIFNQGPPIPEDVMAGMFDPFFTTKPIGKGTGLGLSICTGILGKYGGQIAARNDPGGVTIRVSLPRMRRDAVNTKHPAEETVAQAVSGGGE